MKDPVPAAVRLPVGGTIRFALGSADGARSNVWSVIGRLKHHEVFIGPRDLMGKQKLTLHESATLRREPGTWRWAYTEKEAERLSLPLGVDRLLNRWDAPAPFIFGWLHAVTVTIPLSSIQADPYPIRRLSTGQAVSCYTPEPHTHTLKFEIVLRSPEALDITVGGVHAEVGCIALAGGGSVFVYARELAAVDGRAEAEMNHLRQVARETIIRQIGSDEFQALDKYVGITRGKSLDNGRPMLRDLGDLR